GGALLDACGEHGVLAAEQRVEIALRDLGARCDLERAGAGKAALAEQRKRRLEHALAGRRPASAWLHAACRAHSLFTAHSLAPLALVPGSTVDAWVLVPCSTTHAQSEEHFR